MTLIAVTGGIGAGKTTLMHQFLSLGQSTADADDIAHNLYEPGREAYYRMLERWGKGILQEDAHISRAKVAGIVFTDHSELEWLNSLLHPLARREIHELSQGKTLFCAIPLLYEGGWEKDCDAVVAVWCPPQVQYDRLRNRGWDDNEIQRRLKSQISMDEKMARADYAVITDCDWNCLALQCEYLLKTLGIAAVRSH